MPREKGGTGGLIPQKCHPVLLSYAASIGVPLTAESFLPFPLPTPDGACPDGATVAPLSSSLSGASAGGEREALGREGAHG